MPTNIKSLLINRKFVQKEKRKNRTFRIGGRSSGWDSKRKREARKRTTVDKRDLKIGPLKSSNRGPERCQKNTCEN